MFSPLIVGGSFPSSSTNQVQKGKENVVVAEIQQQEEDLHEIEHDFQLVDSDEHDDNERKTIVIKENDALIVELQVNLQRVKWIISYYKQGNRQFEVKHDLMEIQLRKAKREAKKGLGLT